MSQDDLERRRLKAGSYFKQGKSQAFVAQKFSVSTAATCKWYAKWKKDKERGLLQGKYGRISKMSPRQEKQIQKGILNGPLKCGYDTDYWTLRRLTDYIRKETAISYRDRSVWHTLERFGFSCQKPERRARERDEKAITTWVKTTWPMVKKGASKTTQPLAFSMNPA